MSKRRQRSLRYFMPPRPGGASLLHSFILAVSVEDRSRLDRLLGRLRRDGYLLDDFPTAESLAGAADRQLFVNCKTLPNTTADFKQVPEVLVQHASSFRRQS